MDDRIDSSERGRFGWVMDAEGSRIEPWEASSGVASTSKSNGEEDSSVESSCEVHGTESRAALHAGGWAVTRAPNIRRGTEVRGQMATINVPEQREGVALGREFARENP